MIKPTIGRKIWFRLNGFKKYSIVNFDNEQAMDASINFVHNNNKINIIVVDHVGNLHSVNEIMLVSDDFKPIEGIPYCEWMPYQVGQAKKTE